MLNLFRATVLITALLIAYFGFGGGSDQDLVRKSTKRRQASTNFYDRNQCNKISQMSIVFTDGPGFNKTYEFREACISRGIICTFFINPVTVDSQPSLQGQISGLLTDKMEIGLALPLFPSDLDAMDETTFKTQLYGYANSIKGYIGGKQFPNFVFFKYFLLI